MTTVIRSLLLFATLLIISGCGTLDKTGLYQGDQTLYQFDVAVPAAFQVFDTFVKWEYSNRAFLSPEVTKAADYIRANAPKWKTSAEAVRVAYVADPNPEKRKQLVNLLGVLQVALNQASQYLMAPQLSAKPAA